MIGQYIQQPAGYRAFVPSSFPPADLRLSKKVEESLEAATLSIGRLDGITELLLDIDFFIFMYIRKEAALSSQVEGTRATMVDAMKAEIALTSGLPEDVDDILRYIAALNQGIKMLDEFPLTFRLIREVHETLLSDGGRSHGHAFPGQIRTTQNWINGGSPATARYVPPPPHLIGECLSEIEKFIHDSEACQTLVRAGLAHAQFETVHPFVDGNGRTGRMLVTFMLCQSKALSKPVLYLSEFFKANRDAYFERLQAYHDSSDIEGWLLFFLEGVREVADQAICTVRAINALRDQDMALMATFGKNSKTATRVLQHLFAQPVVSVRTVEGWAGIARPNANALVDKFVAAGILFQTDETKEYGRTFAYRNYLEIF
ncbi:MAG: Fic family protein [Fimbriimonadaceae bacterium]|nr:Fic family protein [Fimbriimonadaceae bacterium]